MRFPPILIAALLTLAAASVDAGAASTQAAVAPVPPTAQAPARKPDVVYIPTPPEVVDAMLALAGVKPGDILYDLGCGDGRFVITAAQKYGIRGVGVDIDPQRIKEANENAQKAGVTDRVTFRVADLFETDLSSASVVTLFLLPELNRKLEPKLLKELPPGARVVSHAFDMADWNPVQELIVGGRHVYLWTMDRVRADVAAAPSIAVPPELRPISIRTIYDATKTGSDWTFKTPPVDLDDATYLQFLNHFRDLIFPDVQSHKSWFELFRLMRDPRTGERAFQYRSVEIVATTLAVSVGNVSDTATWANRATGKSYLLHIEGDQVVFSEQK